MAIFCSAKLRGDSVQPAPLDLISAPETCGLQLGPDQTTILEVMELNFASPRWVRERIGLQ